MGDFLSPFLHNQKLHSRKRGQFWCQMFSSHILSCFTTKPDKIQWSQRLAFSIPKEHWMQYCYLSESLGRRLSQLMMKKEESIQGLCFENLSGVKDLALSSASFLGIHFITSSASVCGWQRACFLISLYISSWDNAACETSSRDQLSWNHLDSCPDYHREQSFCTSPANIFASVVVLIPVLDLSWYNGGVESEDRDHRGQGSRRTCYPLFCAPIFHQPALHSSNPCHS